MKKWYGAKELAGLPGMPGTYRGVIRKGQKEQWTSQNIPAPGGPNGKRREYHTSSLPEETRIALLNQGSGIGAQGSGETTEADLQEYFSSRRIALSPAELADPVWQAKIACAQAYENLPAYKGRERLLETLAAKHNKSKQQIRRWVSDIEALRIRTIHRIKLGDERVELPDSSAFSPEALACGLSLYANDMKAGVKAAYRETERRRVQGAEGPRGQGERENTWRMGDYVSFTRIVKKIPASVWLRIRKGATGFELHGLPKIIKEWTAIPVQSVTCGDQKIIDRYIYDPVIDDVIVPNAYLWMDCASRAITGCWIELGHYNSFTVGCSLREELRWGINDEIYTDWGKPEGSKHIQHILQSLNGHSLTADFSSMEEKYDTCDDDIFHHKAPAGKPWVKPIENIMNIVETRLDAKDMRGYRKKLADPWENKEAQALLKKQGKAGGLMRIEDFITIFFTILDEHNKEAKQLNEGKTIVPWEFFTEGLTHRPGLLELKDQTLDYICLPAYERIPRQCVVHVKVRHDDYRGYYSPKLSGWRQSKGKVRVSIDPYDRSAPAVISTLNGDILDIAEPWHVQNPYDTEGLSLKRHRQAELMKWVNEQARRVKGGFDRYKAPEAKEVFKMLPESALAGKAAEQTKIYQLHKFEQKQETARIRADAIEGQKELAAEFAFLGKQHPEVDPWSLPDGRDKYAYWRKIRGCVELNKPMTDTEQAFYVRYPQTADYRACNGLYEEYGEIYLGGMA